MSRRGEPHETFTVGKYTVNVFQDEHAESPEQWGDEDRYIVAWHDQFAAGPRRRKDSVSSYSEFVHPQHRADIQDLIAHGLLSDTNEPAEQPFDGPADPIWVADYLECCTDMMEVLLVTAGQEGSWANPEGRYTAHTRYGIRVTLWEAWVEYKENHAAWAVFELDVRYYGGGCLRIRLDGPYHGDHTDARGNDHEPDGLVLIKREEGVDPQKAAKELVSMWEQYIEGDVWYYEVLDEKEEIVESCGGYYGLNDCLAEARGTAEHFVKKDNNNSNKEAC